MSCGRRQLPLQRGGKFRRAGLARPCPAAPQASKFAGHRADDGGYHAPSAMAAFAAVAGCMHGGIHGRRHQHGAGQASTAVGLSAKPCAVDMTLAVRGRSPWRLPDPPRRCAGAQVAGGANMSVKTGWREMVRKVSSPTTLAAAAVITTRKS